MGADATSSIPGRSGASSPIAIDPSAAAKRKPVASASESRAMNARPAPSAAYSRAVSSGPSPLTGASSSTCVRSSANVRS